MMIQRPVRVEFRQGDAYYQQDRFLVIGEDGIILASLFTNSLTEEIAKQVADEIATCINHHAPEYEAAVEELRRRSRDICGAAASCGLAVDGLSAALAKIDAMEKQSER